MTDPRAIEPQLQARGVRPTPQRLAVLRALADASHALSPRQVLAAASKECESLGLATVYRTLDVLVQFGLARRVHTSEGCEAVAFARPGHGHHVVCQQCGRVAEFSRCDIESTLQAAAGETGFSVSGHFLEVTGMCAECRTSPRGASDARQAEARTR